MADAEAVRKQRQQQLEEKRKRLEELRKRRQTKSAGLEATSAAEPQSTSAESAPSGPTTAASTGAAAAAGSADPSDGEALDSFIKGLLSTPAGPEPTDGQPQTDGDDSKGRDDTSTTTTTTGPGATGESQSKRREAVTLSLAVGLAKESPPPERAVELYDKGTQTEEGGDEYGADGSSEEGTGDAQGGGGAPGVGGSEEVGGGRLSDRVDGKRMFKSSQAGGEGAGGGRFGSGSGSGRLRAGGEEGGGEGGAAGGAAGAAGGGEAGGDGGGEGEGGRKNLSADEKRDILASDTFATFVERSSKMVERLMGEHAAYDILVDYGKEEVQDRVGSGEALTQAMRFHEDSYTQDRSVTDVRWSPHHPELMLAAYSARGQTASASALSPSSEAEGMVAVWSLAMQHRPETVLTCQSPVLCARFHDFDSHLVIGGSYSGQILVWDIRAKSLPVQRTPLSSQCHAHPVYGMALHGSAKTHSLVTASSDGKVAWWSLGNLHKPTASVQLYEPRAGTSSAERTPVSISSLTLGPRQNPKSLIVGSENGGIYSRKLHSQKEEKVQAYKGHYGMVTSVDSNPGTSRGLQGLLLSSSVDWTTRLWRLEATGGGGGGGGGPSSSSSSSSSTSGGGNSSGSGSGGDSGGGGGPGGLGGAGSPEALMSFSDGGYDYISDAKWSPQRCSVFVTCSISGKLGLWDLTQSTEEPVDTSTKVSNAALNRLSWSGEGRRMAVGDSRGAMYVYSLAEEMAAPRQDEEVRLEGILSSRSSRGV